MITMVASGRDNGEMVGVLNVMFHVGRNFIIQDMLFGCYAGLLEAPNERVISADGFMVLSAFERFQEDGVAVNFNHHHHIFVAAL